MSEPHGNHYIPRMHLQSFADKNGYIHLFYKPEGRSFSVKPENAFVVNDLYTIRHEDGSKDFSAESFLARQEHHASRVIRRIVQSARRMKVPCLSEADRDFWDQYLCYQWKRIPDRILSDSAVDDLRSSVIRNLIREHGLPTQQDLQALHDPDLIQRIRVDAITARSEQLFERLNERRLIVAVRRDCNERFIIGSNPIIPPAQFSDEDSSFWLALTPDIAISYARVPLLGPERLVSVKSDRLVRTFNETTLGQSTTIAGSSRESIESLARKCSAPKT